ncbi:MAG TPA: hypothetical protein VFX97_16870 [Pyrinomonadaceae bacterium]|nr:hypothetical protein [Pyrinomonadaceae bacterium]
MPKDDQTSSEVAKKKYVCAVACDFEGFKPPIHCEAGDPIPRGLTDKQIKEYIEGGLIKEA